MTFIRLIAALVVFAATAMPASSQIIIAPGGGGPIIGPSNCTPFLEAIGACTRPGTSPGGAIAPGAFDLAIENVTCQSNRIRFDVRHNGGPRTDPSVVALVNAAGNIVADFQLDPMFPGQTKRITFSGPFAGRNFELFLPPGADADSANDFASANCGGASFNWILTAEGGGSVDCFGGQFVALVTNQGPTRAPGTTITVSRNGIAIATAQVPPLRANASHRFDFRMPDRDFYALSIPPAVGDSNSADNRLAVNCNGGGGLPPGPTASRCIDLMPTRHRFPDDLAWDGSNLWGVNLQREDTVSVVDVADREFLARFDELRTRGRRSISMMDIDMGLTGMAWDGQFLWLAHYNEMVHPDRPQLGPNLFIWKVEPQRDFRGDLFLREVSSFEFTPWRRSGGRPRGMAWDPSSQTLWVSDDSPDQRRNHGWILELDPFDGTVLTQFLAPTQLPSGLAMDPERGLWVATYDDGDPRFWLLDPRGGESPRSRVGRIGGGVITSREACGNSPTGLAFDGRLWAADEQPDMLFRVRSRSRRR